MPFKSHLFVPGKREYIRGRRRPPVDCILCSIVDQNPEVQSLEVARDRLVVVSVNLYPYNPGHLLLFPRRHVIDPRELTEAETRAMTRWQLRCLDILERLYEPLGFNIGMNVGEASGASIPHMHQHIVPRYHKELGFVDILAGSKIVIEDPRDTQQRISEAFAGETSRRRSR